MPEGTRVRKVHPYMQKKGCAMKRISLSPESAGCLLVMYYGCTPCSLNDICRLCDMQERLAKNIFQELELNNLVCIDKNNKYNILCKNLVYDIFSILDCKLNKNKIFNALSFYYKKDYLTFLDVVIDVLELYESKKNIRKNVFCL